MLVNNNKVNNKAHGQDPSWPDGSKMPRLGSTCRWIRESATSPLKHAVPCVSRQSSQRRQPIRGSEEPLFRGGLGVIYSTRPGGCIVKSPCFEASSNLHRATAMPIHGALGIPLPSRSSVRMLPSVSLKASFPRPCRLKASSLARSLAHACRAASGQLRGYRPYKYKPSNRFETSAPPFFGFPYPCHVAWADMTTSSDAFSLLKRPEGTKSPAKRAQHGRGTGGE